VPDIPTKAVRLTGCIALGWIALANIPDVHAFRQAAIDQLFETGRCLRCDLRGASLAHKDLRGVDLSGAHLIGANLETADMRGANLGGAWLARANLRHANLAGASLLGAYLVDADLTGADLKKANLRDSMLARAELTNANLDEAALSGANMQGTKLLQVQGLAQDQLSASCGDADTNLPRGLSIAVCTDGGIQ
tara:strand:- start:130 stop:708 length:579 start_codon:yes stop_codon:yes gene_type:complete